MDCPEVCDALEAYIEADLPRPQRSAVRRHLAQCANCRRECEQATQVLASLRSLPAKQCSEGLIRDVLRRTRPQPERRRDLRAWVRPLMRPVWRPALVLAVAACLILVLRPLSPRAPQQQPSYSEAEIRQAQAEAKWALAYVHSVMIRTQSIVKEHVIQGRVVRPIRNSVDTAIERIAQTGGPS